MFASGSKAGRASLVAIGAAAVALVASPAAHALEGIQGRHAIFYPSLELVYQHDDNYFLTPTDEQSADTWIVHPHFRLEVPGARQYLALEYHPQWRNVDVDGEEPIEDDIQHFWNLDAKLRGSSLFSADIHHDFSVANIETQPLDENRELVRSGEQFMANDIGVDFKWEGSRQGAIIRTGYRSNSFDDVGDAPAWFELAQVRYGAEYFYKFTPLTRFLLGLAGNAAEQDYTTKNSDITDITSIDSDRTEVYFGFAGELGRTTTGQARLGFASLDYDQTDLGQEDWDGVVLSADVTKSFSRYSKLIFGGHRDVNYSAYARNVDQFNTYYVSNRVGFTFSNQPQGGRIAWTLAGAFQRNGYDVPTTSLFEPALGAYEREDDITHLRAEVGFHPMEHLSFRLNYRYEERESNHDEEDYTDNLIIFQVQFGF